jgi:hypothetical protein
VNGKFVLIRRLAGSGEDRVYLARDLALGRDVALALLPDPDPDGAAIARLRAAARIDRPFAPILGTETWRNTTVIVIEYTAHADVVAALEHLRNPRC